MCIRDSSNVSQKVNEFGVTVENVKGEVADLSVKADKVELSVAKKKDVPLISVRYIRDWLNGSNMDTENKWMECKVIVGVDNIALNIIPTSDVLSLIHISEQTRLEINILVRNYISHI